MQFASVCLLERNCFSGRPVVNLADIGRKRLSGGQWVCIDAQTYNRALCQGFEPCRKGLFCQDTVDAVRT